MVVVNCGSDSYSGSSNANDLSNNTIDESDGSNASSFII